MPLAVLLASGCYDPPVVPRDKPLSCTSSDPGQCPAGYACIAKSICALQNCTMDEQCPLGLVCTSKGACGFPSPGDGGGDGSVTDGGVGLGDGAAGLGDVVPADADAGNIDLAPDLGSPPGLDAGVVDGITPTFDFGTNDV